MTKLEISKKLQDLRVANGYTQKELAEKLGIKNYSTVSSWEVGKSEPNLETFWKLCDLYNIEDIYEVFPDLKRNEFDNAELSQAAQRVARLYDVATDHAKSIVEVTLEPFDETKKGVNAANNDEKGTLAG